MNNNTKNLSPTKLIISKLALANNIMAYRKSLNTTTKMMLMIKAFGYGSGDVAIARFLEEQNLVDYLGVAYPNEGIALRDEGISLPIMVMNPGIIDLEQFAAFNLEPTIYNPEQLNQILQLNPQDIAHIKIHFKIDSGMHRLGFHYEEIAAAAKNLHAYDVQVEGVYTHLASSPEPLHDNFTREQVTYFNKSYDLLRSLLGYDPMRHVLNSAGIIRFPEYQYDMVRAGMGIYGIDPSNERQKDFHLISRFTTKISQINTLNIGETVGYLRRGDIKNNNTHVAILPVGYADGYNRLFSNGAVSVFINGHRAPTIGNVCMDMCFIDVTGIHCNIGDEVELFGPNINIQELASAAKTIDYEILTSIGMRVKREYE